MGLFSSLLSEVNTVFEIRDGVLVKYKGSGKKAVIPNTVTSIKKHAFTDPFIESITIPDSVTSIGDYAFSGCSSLKTITIPNSVTSIGEGAFKRCESLHVVVIPNAVTSIADNTFERCTSLQDVQFPHSLKSIGNYAFRYCGSLRTANLPLKVETIGNYAFEGCSSLLSITIPDSVKTVGVSAFELCYGLRLATISNSKTSIGKDAFRLCDNFYSITVPDSYNIAQFKQNCCGSLPKSCEVITCSQAKQRLEKQQAEELRKKAEKLKEEKKKEEKLLAEEKKKEEKKKQEEARKLEIKRILDSTKQSQKALNLLVTNTEQKDVDVSDIDKSQIDTTLYLRSVVDMFSYIEVLKNNLQTLYYDKNYSKATSKTKDAKTATSLFFDDAIPKAEQALVDSILHLKKLLALDIVHPKYQEYVPLCSICEYFELGRVEKLTGPDGAYNLYESEYRLGTIINKLDTIADKLEDIKAGQYTLYSAITATNKQISNLGDSLKTSLKDIDKTIKGSTETMSQQLSALEYNTAATAYYAKVNAEIAAAPSFGIIF